LTTSASQLPWLPLAKAAEKVSELTGKHHSKADILDAALAGHLSLSVHLISPVFARSGHFQDYAEDAPHGISTNVSLLCAENGISSEKSALLELLGIKDGIFAYSKTLKEKSGARVGDISCRPVESISKDRRGYFGRFKSNLITAPPVQTITKSSTRLRNDSVKIGALWCDLLNWNGSCLFTKSPFTPPPLWM
jgi:hypothetical protein